MKPQDVFYTLDEILEILDRSTVIRCVSDGEACFPGILAPLAQGANNSGSAIYRALARRQIAAYKSLLRLVRQGVFEPTESPKKVSMEWLKHSRGPGHA